MSSSPKNNKLISLRKHILERDLHDIYSCPVSKQMRAIRIFALKLQRMNGFIKVQLKVFLGEKKNTL